ncbi:hypothetical protein MJ588_29340 [Klebsiella pneumoniae]|nr:hypothetical protein MJ588_29340 [Klebsiella pneumoniae]
MGYEYKSLAMNAEQRYVNPAGFPRDELSRQP